MKTVKTFRIWRHGLEWSDYFQGHGIALTKFTDCATGNGCTEKEALDDALSMLADGEWDVSALEAMPEFQEEASALSENTPSAITDAPEDGEHPWVWVSVDVA